MKPNDIPEKTGLQKENAEFFKLQLAAAFKAQEEAKKQKVDTPENLKTAGDLLKSADNCIGGTFTTSIKGTEVKELENNIEKIKSNSKYLSTIKKWAKKFVELCKNPNSISKKKDLEQATELLYKGQPIKIISANPVPKGAIELQKELKAKLDEKLNGKQTEVKRLGKSNLKRSKPVTPDQKPKQEVVWRKKQKALTK